MDMGLKDFHSIMKRYVKANCQYTCDGQGVCPLYKICDIVEVEREELDDAIRYLSDWEALNPPKTRKEGLFEVCPTAKSKVVNGCLEICPNEFCGEKCPIDDRDEHMSIGEINAACEKCVRTYWNEVIE